MEFLLLAVLLGLIPAVIARSKGRSFVLWWIYGAAILIIALPHALLMKTNIAGVEKQKLTEGMKKCPYCAELIKYEAIVCRYCGRDVSRELPPDKIAPPKEEWRPLSPEEARSERDDWGLPISLDYKRKEAQRRKESWEDLKIFRPLPPLSSDMEQDKAQKQRRIGPSTIIGVVTTIAAFCLVSLVFWTTLGRAPPPIP
jgi:hypothetical protein